MRVLFTVPPALGHLFPMMSLAWAVRAAGHEVLLASSGTAVTAAVRSGLCTVDVAPNANFAEAFGSSAGSARARAEQLRERGREIAAAGGDTPDIVAARFAAVSDLMADGTMTIARDWRPDLIVHSRLQGAGPMAATALGTPAVAHGFGFARDSTFAHRFLPHLAATYHRHGVPLTLPELAALHVAPPSMMVGSGSGWAMRYVPYNAGGLLPDWVTRPRERRRVVVTLGTMLPAVTGVDSLRPVLDAAGRTDAEFVLTLGETLRTGLELPDNVRVIDWVPLAALLPASDAVIHHGGAGTTMTAVCVGVPQLVLPHAADQFLNADVVARHGIGLTCAPDEVDADTVAAMLDADRYAAATAAVHAEIASMPRPVDVVDRLVAFAERPMASSRQAIG